MTYPNIFDDEPLFNSILLNGVISPGKVTLSGHESKIAWDVKTGPALIGASVTFKGEPPVEFSASFYLVKDVTQGIDDFQAWPAFQAIIEDFEPRHIASNAARALTNLPSRPGFERNSIRRQSLGRRDDVRRQGRREYRRQVPSLQGPQDRPTYVEGLGYGP